MPSNVLVLRGETAQCHAEVGGERHWLREFNASGVELRDAWFEDRDKIWENC